MQPCFAVSYPAVKGGCCAAEEAGAGILPGIGHPGSDSPKQSDTGFPDYGMMKFSDTTETGRALRLSGQLMCIMPNGAEATNNGEPIFGHEPVNL